jgi:hypothetical protein
MRKNTKITKGHVLGLLKKQNLENDLKVLET